MTQAPGCRSYLHSITGMSVLEYHRLLHLLVQVLEFINVRSVGLYVSVVLFQLSQLLLQRIATLSTD